MASIKAKKCFSGPVFSWKIPAAARTAKPSNACAQAGRTAQPSLSWNKAIS
jgi:hypothetical protein